MTAEATSATWVSALADGVAMDRFGVRVRQPDPGSPSIVLWLASAQVGTVNRGFAHYRDTYEDGGTDGLALALRRDGWRMPEPSTTDSAETP